MDSPIVPMTTRRQSSQKEKSAAKTTAKKEAGPGVDLTGWQNSVDLTASQRHEVILRNGLYRDMLFHVGKKAHPIYAHKILLAMGSTVFADMFYATDEVEVDIPVRITDVEPDIFEILLMSIYCIKEDGVDFTNAVDVLKAAQKYGAKKLEAFCMSKLYDGIDPNDHFAMYIKAYMVNDIVTVTGALNKIDQAFLPASKFDSFLKLSVKDLTEIFRRDSLDAYELDIYQAAERWAEAVCKNHKSDNTADNRRAVLGEALEQIRFSLMNPDELANGPVKTGLLLNDDIADIMRVWFQKDPPTIRFCTRNRGPAPQGEASAKDSEEENHAPEGNGVSAGKRKALLPSPERPMTRAASNPNSSPEKAQRSSSKKSRF